MGKLKLGPLEDDKPVKISVELPAALHRDLRGAEHVAGGNQAQRDSIEVDHLAVSEGSARLRPVAACHDRQRLGRGPDLSMASPGMIGMAMGDECARLRLARVDPRVGRLDVDAFGKRLYPGTETGHREI